MPGTYTVRVSQTSTAITGTVKVTTIDAADRDDACELWRMDSAGYRSGAGAALQRCRHGRSVPCILAGRRSRRAQSHQRGEGHDPET